jgi:DNA primase
MPNSRHQSGATPSNGGVQTAPRFSTRVETALTVMQIAPDLVDALRSLPDQKREEVEKHLIPALETVVWIVATGATSANVEYATIRSQYPPDIAESIIIGIEAREKRQQEPTTEGGTTHAE